jgi:hypothetical protein
MLLFHIAKSIRTLTPGHNPSIASYDASAENAYVCTTLHFKNKNVYILCKNTLACVRTMYTFCMYVLCIPPDKQELYTHRKSDCVLYILLSFKLFSPLL